ncbi:MAG TPA: phage tail protein [Stellaceae bacterium]|jgi:phage tail-like protein|nr:phage tail protein [Stellaceae bacterium]
MAGTQHNSLLQYLPAIYQEEPFLGHFLLAFEKLLFGHDDQLPRTGLPVIGEAEAQELVRDHTVDRIQNGAPPALERTIAGVAAYFDPLRTPEDFLPWLASWTAFSLRADLGFDKQRDFIGKIISLYRRRGTKQNLEDLLSIFTVGRPTVEEIVPGGTTTAGFIRDTTLTVGGTITGTWAPGQMVSGGTTAAGTYIVRQLTGATGKDGTYQVSVYQTVQSALLASDYVHFFSVKLTLERALPEAQLRQIAIARALIELEKPAHTNFVLQPEFLGLQIGVHSTIGRDTQLGSGQV